MEKDWIKYWQEDASSEQVFANTHGQKNNAIKAFWQAWLEHQESKQRLLDVACGAGSIFRDYDSIDRFECFGLDIAEAALEKLSTDLPFVKTKSASLSEMPFNDGEIDLVCSQFGIEYGGLEAFKEAARVLKLNGKFRTLSHIKGGSIDAQTCRKLEALNALVESDFLGAAMQVAFSFRKDEAKAVESAVQVFSGKESQIYQLRQSYPDGQHVHIYDGIRALLSNFNRYKFDDIVDWIERAQLQVNENKTRLESMHQACLSTEDIESLSEVLSEQGLQISHARFYLPDQALPLAWEIDGVKTS